MNRDHVFCQAIVNFFRFQFASRLAAVHFEFLLHFPVEASSVFVEKGEVLFWQTEFLGNFLEFFRNERSFRLFGFLLPLFFLRFWWFDFNFISFRSFLNRKTEFHRLFI